MKKLLLVLFVPFLFACSDACTGIDCISEESFAFTVKSAESEEDLLSGDDPQISEEDIEAFYMVNGIKEVVALQLESGKVRVALNRAVATYFVEVLNKTDTIEVQSARKEATECCPSSMEIEGVKLNGNTVNGGAEALVLYR